MNLNTKENGKRINCGSCFYVFDAGITISPFVPPHFPQSTVWTVEPFFSWNDTTPLNEMISSVFAFRNRFAKLYCHFGDDALLSEGFFGNTLSLMAPTVVRYKSDYVIKAKMFSESKKLQVPNAKLQMPPCGIPTHKYSDGTSSKF